MTDLGMRLLLEQRREQLEAYIVDATMAEAEAHALRLRLEATGADGGDNDERIAQRRLDAEQQLAEVETALEALDP